MNYDEGVVSIVMPTFNCGAFISETIESILVQTYIKWELIIVDDQSTDNTKNIVNKYCEADRRIKYHVLEKNSGAAVARTEAIKLSKGEYIAFCDADDLWFPEKLEKQLNFMKDNNIYFSSTSYEKIDEKSRELGKTVKSVAKVSYNRLLLDCPVGNSTVMYNVSKMGKFEVPNLRKRNDDALWLKMLKVEPYIYGMPEILMKYRIRKGSISRNKVDLVRYHWKLYREIEHLTILRSVFHILVWGIIKIFRLK
ncbi:glycosyltransferase family 2 protein [Streptococcus suis]|uniref:glycosyltransferase family 2 protein n=1 Tax=Streptococcus suis TaxID=1307 RepID=UPI0028EBD8C9|nr:glycosyltransferase family 2 protein [Streptococcus suis]